MAPPLFRRCVICRRLAHRDEFWRIVREGNTVKLDQGMGRSVYVCRQGSCLQEALKKNRLSKALRTPLPPIVVAELRQRAASSAQANSSLSIDNSCHQQCGHN
ncbi:MAG: YlxR family protein [Pseudanabaenaceae cyanobacterium SKYGB_i_bin29]|nr:YlxR family protein [Pseudanabaenaceae cyanobacterium SKYG29]MDW8422566.1 YlxR family protein [Pseudanabaenaceae cyanobacterium SKYGB_i_bin29]